MASASDNGFDDLFDLSLEQLSSISVKGAAVRSLNLALIPDSNNSHQLENRYLSSSVEVIDHKTIEARGLKNVVQVVESMVGILSGESPSEPYSFSSRGFSRNSINVLYDGVSMGMSTLNMRPQSTFNVERIEVIKGAASLSAEEGGTGGTVNIISKKPLLGQVTSVDVLASYGRFNTSSANVALMQNINEKSALRFDLSRNGSDGWVDDTDSESLNSTASYLFAPSDNFNITASLNYLDDSLPAYWGTPLVPASVALKPVTSVVKTDANQVIDEATRYINYNVADNVIESTSLWSRLDMNWQFSEDTRMQATLYQFHADRLWENAEYYQYQTATDDVYRYQLSVSHERQLRGFNIALHHGFGDEFLRHNLAVKLESSVNNFNRGVGYNGDNDEFVDLYNPAAGVVGSADPKRDKQTRILDAAILEHRMSFMQGWHLDLGMRIERISFDRLKINTDDTINSTSSLDAVINQNSYRLGLLYEFSPQISAYGHYAKKHDPIEEDIKFFSDLANFEPSDVEQWELGLKSTFNENRTELTFAWYDINKTVDDRASAAAIKRNEQTSQGAEFAVKHEFNEQFRLGGNLAYTDAKYGYFFDPEEDEGAGLDVSGNTPVNVPKSMLSAWASYNTVGVLPVEMGLGYNRVDKRFANSKNTTELDAYQLLNVFVAYEKNNYRLGFNVRNVTDEIYAPWSDVFYPNQVALGSPRTYELSFRARF